MNTAAGPFYKRLSLNMPGIALILLLHYLAQGIFVPFFIAILFASLRLPVVHFFQKLILSNLSSITVAAALAVTLTVAVIYFSLRQFAAFLAGGVLCGITLNLVQQKKQ